MTDPGQQQETTPPWLVLLLLPFAFVIETVEAVRGFLRGDWLWR